jgi:hypothetical protein
MINSIGRFWHRIATFFEQGDLVPFAVIISIYHYYKALAPAGDPVWVAIPVALFVDLLHFRTIRRACTDRGRAAIWIAVGTTVMALAYHFIFYGQVVGNALMVAVYSVPIPAGIAVMAWHVANKPVDGRAMLIGLFRNRVKSVLKIARRLQSQMTQLEIERQAVTRQLEATGKELEAERKRRETAENQLAELETMRKTFARLGTFGQDIVMLVGGNGISQREIATRHGVSEAEVSRLKAKLNGGKGQSSIIN